MLSTPRKLSIIKETVAIVEPPIEDSSSSEINAKSSSGMSPKINHSQPDLQLILNMPYGSFLGIIKKSHLHILTKLFFSLKKYATIIFGDILNA